jgi:hypothetical protein
MQVGDTEPAVAGPTRIVMDPAHDQSDWPA